MNSETAALLVIDMQLVAFTGEATPPISTGARVVDAVVRLLDVCRSAGVPVMFAQTSAIDGQPYARDVQGWELHPDLGARPDEKVVSKVGPSVFENPDFERDLASRSTRHLIVCGIWTEGCVSITSRGAMKRGYGVYLAADAHGTVRSTDAEADAVIAAENTRLAERGAIVESISEIRRRLHSA